MLHSDEVGSNKGNVINLAEHPDNSTVIDAGNEHSEKICEKGRLLLQVEGEGLVVAKTGAYKYCRPGGN